MSRQKTALSVMVGAAVATTGYMLWRARSSEEKPPHNAAPPASDAPTTPDAPAEASATARPEPAVAMTSCTMNTPCPNRPKVSPDIPANLTCTTQNAADCMAWQDFIALNWPASPSDPGQPDTDASTSSYGEPADAGSFQSVVWEGYKSPREVFLPDGGTPPPWDAAPPAETCAGLPSSRLPDGHPPVGVLASARLVGFPELTPGSAHQASGETAWIADVQGNLVWYQIGFNQVELDYIVDAGAYNAEGQWALSVPGKPGVSPPSGSIEIKAAWRRITDPSQYGRYLMASACIPKGGGGLELAQLGLVGLHIVHKVPYQPQWLWATFEQVDNVPTAGSDAGAPTDAGFSFYASSCDASAVPARCRPDAGDVCAPNTLPGFGLDPYLRGAPGACAPYPTRIVRSTPIPDDDSNPVAKINTLAQATIRRANPDSVLQYYQLINAMWWAQITDGMDGGVAAPLSTTTPASLQPQGTPVANTVLETYDQVTIDNGPTTSTCLACHAYASVAKVAGQDGGTCDGGPCAADFSFVFDDAKSAGNKR